MDLKVPILITDELTEEVITSTGFLDLASGEINRVEYQNYNADLQGLPSDSEDYEFTSGILTNNGKDVEFRVDVNKTTGQYSVSASELLEVKIRAAALFAGISPKDMLASAEAKASAGKPAEPPPGGARKGRLH